MKARALSKFRSKITRREPVYGIWITLESPSITEIAVAMGMDWVVIDAEHGHLDWKDLCEHVRATVRSDTVILIRIAENSESMIKRALDIGADGVVIPWVETVEELQTAIGSAHYPPKGRRGIGAERATCWGQCFVDHVAEAEDVLVVPIIESVTATRNAAQLAAVDGAEVFFFGPADLSATAGHPGEWEGGNVPELIAEALKTITSAGKTGGILSRNEADLKTRATQGFQMLGLGTDTSLMVAALRSMLRPLDLDRPMKPGFTLENDPASVALEEPLNCAPVGFEPDRREMMIKPGTGPQIEIAPGISFDCMVGAFNNAKNLTTGNVLMRPGAILAYHRHTFDETVTLLQGSVSFEVEGRIYAMRPYDNVSVPAGLAHKAYNNSRDKPAVLHIAMASTDLSRELVDSFFSKRQMPPRTTTYPKGERFTCFTEEATYSPGPNANFVDYFNAEILPGFTLSGGYGNFEQNGRLPAHLHDFDESIYIAHGKATCLVEGREYQQATGDTALQPRGRIHYFINRSPTPMTMLWVYAGPMPERIVLEDACANQPGLAWENQ